MGRRNEGHKEEWDNDEDEGKRGGKESLIEGKEEEQGKKER